MADLNNLLDEVDYDENDENEEEEDVALAFEQEEDTADLEDDYNTTTNNRREQLEVPAALEEYERRLRRRHDDDDEDIPEEEEDIMGDDEEQQYQQGDDESGKESSQSHQSSYYNKLKRMWQQELACPELLPLDEETLLEIRHQIEERDVAISELMIQADDTRALLASVLKVDIDRSKFMMNDLLRTRLWKIQEHPLHMRELTDRMSDAEVDFLKGYGQLLEGHLRSTVLDHVSKDAFKNLDDPEMIDRPDLHQYVFVKVKETCIIDSGTEDEPFEQQHQAGTTLITRYSVVRELFGQGRVELVL